MRLYEFGLDKGSIERIARKNPKGLAKLGSAIKARIEQRRMQNLSDAERSRLQSLRRAERLISQKAEALNNAKQAVAARAAEDKARYFEDRAEYLSLDEKDRAAWLKDRGYTAEDFAPGVLEKEDVSTIPQKYREEYLAASKETEQAETKKAAEAVEKDVRFSIKTVDGIGKVAYIDEDLIPRKPGQTFTEAVKEYFDTYLKGMEIPVESSGDTVTVQQKKKFFDKASKAKKDAVQILDDIISIGENKVHADNIRMDSDGKIKKHTGLSAERGWDYYKTHFEIGEQLYEGRVVIRKSGDGNDYFYDLDSIKTVDTPVSLTGTQSRNGGPKGVSTINSISQSSENVNPKSEKSDVKFSRVTPAQNEEKSDVRFPKVESSQSEAKKAENGLRKQLEQWIAGDYRKSFFNAGETPLALTRFGAAKGDLIIYEDCIRKVTGGKHSIAIEELAKIPSELADPILLFKGSVENSFVALTEMKDKQGNDVIVAIHLNKQKGRFAINKIASVYSKSDDFGNNKIVPYVFNQIQKGNLVDASYKKASNWFMSRGLQLPKQVQTILDAYSTSIPQNSDLSTPESKKSSDVKFSKSAEATEKVEIARIFTFGCKNNADIIRRLMGTSKFFKGMSFYDAAQQFRYAERNGLVHRGDGFLVVYHDPNPDIRFSKVDPRPGQSKVYSKEDAADVISSIMAERMKFGDEHFAIEAGLRKGKTAEATRQLFEYLNTLDPGEKSHVKNPLLRGDFCYSMIPPPSTSSPS